MSQRYQYNNPQPCQLISGEDTIRAATTIHHKMHDTVILSFLTDKLSNQEKVNRLVSECLDETGRPLAKRKTASKKVKAFNVDKFV